MARHNKRDKQHSEAQGSFARISAGRTGYSSMYTSDYVFDEAVTGCRRRTRNQKLSVELGTMILSSESIVMERVNEEVLAEAWELYKSRRELELSITDCTSAVLARKLGIVDVYTYDKDFASLGFRALRQL